MSDGEKGWRGRKKQGRVEGERRGRGGAVILYTGARKGLTRKVTFEQGSNTLSDGDYTEYLQGESSRQEEQV